MSDEQKVTRVKLKSKDGRLDVEVEVLDDGQFRIRVGTYPAPNRLSVHISQSNHLLSVTGRVEDRDQ